MVALISSSSAVMREGSSGRVEAAATSPGEGDGPAERVILFGVSGLSARLSIVPSSVSCPWDLISPNSDLSSAVGIWVRLSSACVIAFEGESNRASESDMEAGVGAMEAAAGGGDMTRASDNDMDPGVGAGGVAAGGGDKNNASDKDIDAGVPATGVGSAVGVAGWLSSGVLVCRARVEEASRPDTARIPRPKLGVAPS